MINFKDINFGNASAEEESTYHPELLMEGFLDPWDIVNKSISGQKCLFLGYKGSGKSAIGEHLRLLAKIDHSLFVSHTFLSDFPYANFSKIITGEGEPESRFPSAWTWILILNLLDSFSKDEGADSAQDEQFVIAIKALQESGLLPNTDLHRTVIASSKPKFKAKIPILLEMEWDPNKTKANDLDFLHIIDKLKSVVMNFKSSSKHLLVIDGLDDILLHKEIQYQSLAALILEFTRLNAQFAKNKVPAKIIVLCRTELYERLPGPNKNKIRQDSSIELDWYHNPQTPESSNLVHLVNNRATLSDKDIKSVFLNYFPLRVSNQPVLFYLLQHTRHTPRDFIQLLTHIQGCSRKQKLEIPEVMAGIRNYSSKYFLPEIKDELVGYLSVSQIDELIRAISKINKLRFTLKELSEQLVSTGLLNEFTLSKITNLLFQCSAIGNVQEDYQGKRHFSFKYRNRHAFFNDNELIAVHRGLWQSLRLRTQSG